MKSTILSNYRDGVRDGIPIALGYLAVAFTLGIAARNFRIGAFPATLMSLLNFTSAGEFAALGIISAGAPYLEMIFSQAVINLRYLLMSCALSQKTSRRYLCLPSFSYRIFYHGRDLFGVSSSRPGKLNPFYTYGTASIAIPGWSLGTCLGVILGTAPPGPDHQGFKCGTLWHVPGGDHPSCQKKQSHRRSGGALYGSQQPVLHTCQY